MQISTQILMHTIKHIRFLCHYGKKTCSDDKKHLHELIVQVSLILSNSQFVCSLYNTVLSVWNSFVVVSLAKWNYFKAMIVMIMMMVVHLLNLHLTILNQI